jgi:hypothetical protein
MNNSVDEFKNGDVIAMIGSYEKWLVMMNPSERNMFGGGIYGLVCLEGFNKGSYQYFLVDGVEKNYVKVE